MDLSLSDIVNAVKRHIADWVGNDVVFALSKATALVFPLLVIQINSFLPTRFLTGIILYSLQPCFVASFSLTYLPVLYI